MPAGLSLATWYGTDPRLEQALSVRRAVFVEEQAVPLDEELDGNDHVAWHVLASLEGRPVATARLLAGAEAKVGRVAVLSHLRGRSLGARVMRAAEELAGQLGAAVVCLDAQLGAQGFYEKLGYEAEGGIFLDAGIEHRRMRRQLPAVES